MRSYVIDASVGVKWCLPPETTPLGHESFQVLEGFQRGDGLFYARSICWRPRQTDRGAGSAQAIGAITQRSGSARIIFHRHGRRE